ncbi:hypothetical protein Tco_0663491, partial [Tanacetum coccineum]
PKHVPISAVPKGVDITARSRASSSSKLSHSRGALTSGRCFCDGVPLAELQWYIKSHPDVVDTADSSMEAAFDTSQDTLTTEIVESMTTNVGCDASMLLDPAEGKLQYLQVPRAAEYWSRWSIFQVKTLMNEDLSQSKENNARIQFVYSKVMRKQVNDPGNPNVAPPRERSTRLQTDTDLNADERKQVKFDAYAINCILLSIPNSTYSSVDCCKDAKAVWEGESLDSYYHRFSRIMKDLKRYNLLPKRIVSNTKFLNCLQHEWKRDTGCVGNTSRNVRNAGSTSGNVRSTSRNARITWNGQMVGNYGHGVAVRVIRCYNYNGEGQFAKDCKNKKTIKD